MDDLNTQLDRMKSDGWCVLDEVIPAAQVEEIRESVLATVARHRRTDAPDQIGFLPSIINHDRSFAPYLVEPRLLALVTALLGEQVRISFTSAIINEPGNARGGWHADWPYNQRNAGHLPTPYPDLTMHLTTLWMVSPFSAETGGTLVVPGSHHLDNNPTGGNGIDPLAPYPGEVHAEGSAGSVLVMDSRVWHATAPNQSNQPRVALAVRYAPWWLDTRVLMPGSAERTLLQAATGKSENEVPAMPRSVYEQLPQNVQPLYAHWIAD